MEIIISEEWIKRKLTIEEAEVEHLVIDERLGSSPIPFGFCNSEWKTLVARMREEDELWEFASPTEFFRRKMGRKGIVLISEGKVVGGILTSMS